MFDVRLAGLCLLIAFGPVAARAAENAAPPIAAQQKALHGVILSVSGDVLLLRLRNGQTESIDISAAKAAHHTGVMPIGGAVVVYGTRDASGAFHA
ncbi:MAG TPA: hypothetical protein VKG44_10045, partial [Candidatus Baltobacteraceae bacterium]|nr:hypothetical protein [Candidatus Baltobacteraceae bacterium]